jgi:hypothetical protein
MASGSATKKVAGGARNGEVQKKGSPEKGQVKKRLTTDGNNCIFCSDRNNRHDKRGNRGN